VKKSKKCRFKKEKKDAFLNEDGSEICDSKPTKLRQKVMAPVTMRQKMKQMWKDFAVREAERESIESIEDAADFDVSNDDFPRSQYETEGSLKHVLEYVDEDIKEAVAQQQHAEGIEAEGGKQGEEK
jgi:hypothetical protein